MGLLGMVMPVYNLLLTIVTFGLPTILARFVAMDLAKGKKDKILEHKRASLLLVFLFASIIALGIYSFSPKLSTLLYKDARTELVLKYLAPLLILNSFSLIYRGYYRGLGKTLPLAISEMSGVLAETAYLICCLYKTSLPGIAGRVNLIMMGNIYGEIVTFLTLLFWEKTIERYRLSPKPNQRQRQKRGRRHLRAGAQVLLKSGVPLLMQDLLFATSRMADGVLIPRLLLAGGLTTVQATKTVGFYWGLTLPMYFLPLMFLFPLTTIILPASARAVAGKNTLRPFFKKSRSLLLITIIYGVFAFLVLNVWGKEISSVLFNHPGANKMLFMMVPALPFSAFNLILNSMMEGLGLQDFLCRASLTTIIIKTGITTALVPLPAYGIIGAAWGFIIAQVAQSLFLGVKMYRLGLFTA